MTHNIDSTVLTEAMELLIEHDIDGFTIFRLLPYQRRRLRSTNMLERLNKEIKRRTGLLRFSPMNNHCSSW